MTIIEQIREAVRQCQLNCKAAQLPFHPDDFKLYQQKRGVDKEFKDLSSEEKQEFLRFLMIENNFNEVKDQEFCYLLLASLLERGIKKTRKNLQMTLNMEPSDEWTPRNLQVLLMEDKRKKLVDLLTKQNHLFKPFQKKEANVDSNKKDPIDNQENKDNKNNNDKNNNNESEVNKDNQNNEPNNANQNNNSNQGSKDKSNQASNQTNVKHKINQNKEESDGASTDTDDDDNEEENVVRFEYSETVEEAQILLNQNGENIVVNGIFNDVTENAVISYQKKKKLVIDGMITKYLIKILKGKNFKNFVRILGGVDLKADIQTVKNIRGVQFTKSGQVKFLVDKGKEGCIENGVNSEELALCLSVYFDSSINSKDISFSLDAWEETNPDGPFQKKVLFPDIHENRKILEGSKFGELMFECDYLLKQMSLGFMPDCVTPFNYPEELIQKGMKPRHQIPDGDDDNPDKKGASRWCRLWLVCRKITGVIGKQSNGVFLSDDVEIGVDARQMEQDQTGKLIDKKIQNTSDSSYIFAQKFSELYPVICKYYPCFEQLKRLYRASAMAKWIFKNGVQVDLKKVNQVAAKQFLNHYENKVAVIQGSKVTSLGEKEKKIPVDVRIVAIRSLEKGNYEITEEKIKWASEQLIEKNGGKNEFYDTHTIEQTIKNSVFGGVDMNCEIQQKEVVNKLKESEGERENKDHGKNQKNSSFWSEVSTEVDEKALRERIIEEEFGFELEADCEVCKKPLSLKEMQSPLDGKRYCSLHHPRNCFYCGKMISGAAILLEGRQDLYDSESFKGTVRFHQECCQIFEGKIYGRAKLNNQNEAIEQNREHYLTQIKNRLQEIKSLDQVVLKKPANFTCPICKKINYFSTSVSCSLCGRVEHEQVNNFLRESLPNIKFV